MIVPAVLGAAGRVNPIQARAPLRFPASSLLRRCHQVQGRCSSCRGPICLHTCHAAVLQRYLCPGCSESPTRMGWTTIGAGWWAAGGAPAPLPRAPSAPTTWSSGGCCGSVSLYAHSVCIVRLASASAGALQLSPAADLEPALPAQYASHTTCPPTLPAPRDKLMREAYAADVALWDQYLLDKLAALLISLNTCVLLSACALVHSGVLWLEAKHVGPAPVGPAGRTAHLPQHVGA